MTEHQLSADLVHRVCPCCAEKIASPYLEKGALRLVQCGNCSMIYANPVESALASGQFYDRLSVTFYLSRDKLESVYVMVRFELELWSFRSSDGKGTVL